MMSLNKYLTQCEKAELKSEEAFREALDILQEANSEDYEAIIHRAFNIADDYGFEKDCEFNSAVDDVRAKFEEQ